MQGHRLLPQPPTMAAAPLAVPAAAPAAGFPPGVVKDILFSGTRSASGHVPSHVKGLIIFECLPSCNLV